MSTAELTLDTERVQQFAGRILDMYAGGMVGYMIHIGHVTGLFEQASRGPATSDGLAARAGLNERYVREWLGSLVTAGIFEYDPADKTYRLPPEHAACLTGESNDNLARFSQLNTHLAGHVDRVSTAFREGGGVPYPEFRPEFTDVMDVISRNTFDDLLIEKYLPLAPGLVERLDAGATAVDLGCGTGHANVLLGQRFPNSTFVGYDLAPDAIERAREEARRAGTDNVRFEVKDVSQLDPAERYDVVMEHITLHDLVDPVGMLNGAFRALVDDGILLISEPTVSSRLEENVENPVAPWIYGISTLHCLTVSLAEDGAGLGTAFGEQTCKQMLHEAGFVDIAAYEVEGNPLDKVYVARRPA